MAFIVSKGTSSVQPPIRNTFGPRNCEIGSSVGRSPTVGPCDKSVRSQEKLHPAVSAAASNSTYDTGRRKKDLISQPNTAQAPVEKRALAIRHLPSSIGQYFILRESS